LWREQWVNREFNPAAVAQQVLFEQHVVDVMTGVAFVAGQVDRSIDVDRQVGVDLDQTAVVPLIPVVAAPALAGDVLDREAFTRWQRDVLQRPAAAAVDRGFEYRVEPLARDDETAAERVVAVYEWSVPWKLRFELRQHARKIRLRMRRRCRIVQGF